MFWSGCVSSNEEWRRWSSPFLTHTFHWQTHPEGEGRARGCAPIWSRCFQQQLSFLPGLGGTCVSHSRSLALNPAPGTRPHTAGEHFHHGCTHTNLLYTTHKHIQAPGDSALRLCTFKLIRSLTFTKTGNPVIEKKPTRHTSNWNFNFFFFFGYLNIKFATRSSISWKF